MGTSNFLQNLTPLQPPNLGLVTGSDGVDTDYSFAIYPITSVPSARNAVYMFCQQQSSNYVPVYIGKADDLSSRLHAHERINEAMRLGATHLLVHVPGLTARVHYLEAERRLIYRYQPVLNTTFR